MTTPQQTPRGYAPPPVYGKWRQWLQGAAAMYALYALGQFIAIPAAAAGGSLAALVSAGMLTRACLLARDEGRTKRALAEELETGARPYGIVPPVLPAKAHRRPRFWVYAGLAVSMVYGGVSYALLTKTAHKSQTKYSGNSASGYSFDPPVQYSTSTLALLSTVGILLTAGVVYFAMQAHLRITECISAPVDWWDGDNGAGYAGGYGYPETAQFTTPHVTGYDGVDPAYAQPAPSSGDPLADFVNGLSNEDAARLAAHFGGAGAGYTEADDAPRSASPSSPQHRSASGRPSLDDLLGDD